MKKLLAVILWSGLAIAQVPVNSEQEYVVPNFTGGINLFNDSTNLAPNQATDLWNLTLDESNVLKARYGIGFWDSVIIDSNYAITSMTTYQPYDTVTRLIFVCNGYIYHYSSLSRPAGAINWKTWRLPLYNGFGASMTHDALTMSFNDSLLYLYSRVPIHATLKLQGDSIYYGLTINNNNDSSGQIDRPFPGTTDEYFYALFPYVGNSNVTFKKYQDKLYIFSDYPGFTPLVYNDTDCTLLNVIDKGYVSDTIPVDTTYFLFGGEQAYATPGNNQLYCPTCDSNPNYDIGDQVSIMKDIQHGNGWLEHFRWTASISEITPNGHIIKIDRPAFAYNPNYPGYYYDQRGGWFDFEITRRFGNCIDSGYAIVDSLKNWNDFVGGNTYLQNFYAVTGDSGNYWPHLISCNDDSTFSISSKFRVNSRYYIFSSLNGTNLDSGLVYNRNMNYGIFHHGVLYGFGSQYYNPDSGQITIGKMNIWYSGISDPRNIKNYLTLDDIPTVMFILYDILFVASENNIWSISADLPDATIKKIVSGTGISSYNDVALGSNQDAYFLNQNGLYYFNGVTAEKISYQFDKLLNKYSKSSHNLTYFKERLYINYPDSNVSVCYNEVLKVALPLGIGITSSCPLPVDTTCFFIGLNAKKGRIYFYPDTSASDRITPGTPISFPIRYASGWQSFGGYWTDKTLDYIDWPLFSTGSNTIKVYIDFSSSACDSFATDSVGHYTFRPAFANCTGRYFKISLSSTGGNSTKISGYRAVWQKRFDSIR